MTGDTDADRVVIEVGLDPVLAGRVAEAAGGRERMAEWIAEALRERLGAGAPASDPGLGMSADEVRALAAAAPQRPDDQLRAFLRELGDSELREIWERRVEPMWREAGRELVDRHAAG